MTSRTFCTIIRDSSAEGILGQFSEVWGKAQRWTFREIHVKRRAEKDVKREALRQFGITGRHFNGLSIDLDQHVNAWRGGLEFHKTRLKDRIEAVQEKIRRLRNKLNLEKIKIRRKPLSDKQKQSVRLAIHQKQRHIGRMRHQIARIDRDLSRSVPRLCFGGAERLRKAQAVDDIWRWKDVRAGRLFLVGSRGETGGNQSIRWDGEALYVRLPSAERGVLTRLSGVRFRRGGDEITTAMAAGQAVTWLLFRDEKGVWQVRATIDVPPAPKQTDIRSGTVAVDLNFDHLAVAMINQHGNLIERKTLPFPVAGTPADKASAIVGDSVAQICAWAKDLGYGVACEKLDFSKKKASLKSFGKAHARRLSGFAFKQFAMVLASRCSREGVDLVSVNPAYTSVIGGEKYAPWRGLSRHHAAAWVIGRRAMGFGESFVCMDGVTLEGPGRNHPRHVPFRWRDARRRLAGEGDLGSPVRTPRSAVGRSGDGHRHAWSIASGPGVGVKAIPARTIAVLQSGGVAVGPPIQVKSS